MNSPDSQARPVDAQVIPDAAAFDRKLAAAGFRPIGDLPLAGKFVVLTGQMDRDAVREQIERLGGMVARRMALRELRFYRGNLVVIFGEQPGSAAATARAKGATTMSPAELFAMQAS